MAVRVTSALADVRLVLRIVQRLLHAIKRKNEQSSKRRSTLTTGYLNHVVGQTVEQRGDEDLTSNYMRLMPLHRQERGNTASTVWPQALYSHA